MNSSQEQSSSRLEYYQLRVNSGLLQRPSHCASLRGWRVFRSKCAAQRPDLSHYWSLAKFKGSGLGLLSSPLKTSQFSKDRSIGRPSIQQCMGLYDLKRASGVISEFTQEDWGKLSPVYRRELAGLASLLSKKLQEFSIYKLT